MIRASTAVWVALAGTVGFGLYHLKHEVQALEDDLFRVNRAILAEQEAIHVLHAEWNYLNQPVRLQALATRHLDLQPMKPRQLGTLADLPRASGERPPSAPAPSAPMASATQADPASLAAARPLIPALPAQVVADERHSPPRLN